MFFSFLRKMKAIESTKVKNNCGGGGNGGGCDAMAK